MAARTTWKAHIPSFFPRRLTSCVSPSHHPWNESFSHVVFCCWIQVRPVYCGTSQASLNWFVSFSLHWQTQTKTSQLRVRLPNQVQKKQRGNVPHRSGKVSLLMRQPASFYIFLRLWFWKKHVLFCFFAFCFSSDCGEPFSQALENLCGVICREPNSLSSRAGRHGWSPVGNPFAHDTNTISIGYLTNNHKRMHSQKHLTLTSGAQPATYWPKSKNKKKV